MLASQRLPTSRHERNRVSCTALPLRRLQHVAEPAPCVLVAVAGERWQARGPRDEDAIEKEEGDPEVLIHEAVIVESPVMDVVSLAGRDEPALQAGSALHPEVVDVHAVVEIAEHEKAPGQRPGDEDRLMYRGHVQEVERGDGYG